MSLGITVPVQTQTIQALEENGPDGRAQPYFAQTYRSSTAPLGFVAYCRREIENCLPNTQKKQTKNFHSTFSDSSFLQATPLTNAPRGEIILTHENWNRISFINQDVNHTIRPMSDQTLYGEAEYWALPAQGGGDCEDYALLKRQQLEEEGFPSRSLFITVVLDETGQGHAVLMVRTNVGDFILDNRKDDVLIWSQTGYTFLKRQTEENPTRWVSLTEDERFFFLTVAKGK